MAVTSIWPVKGNVSKVINYARNPEKTTEAVADSVAALHAIDGVIQYAANDLKTESRAYVTCFNCFSEDYAAADFKATRNLWESLGKTYGERMCYHGYQSFREGEVDAETAHKIGCELARRLWADRFQVVVATHCNTDNYHNHFIINGVAENDGTPFYNSHEDYRRMREESDRLCREFGLSVIESPKGHGRNYAEYQAEKQGKPTTRGMIRKDIDRAVAGSITREDFFCFLEDIGYELKLFKQNGDWLEYPSLKPPGAKGFFRFHKLGPGYDLHEIEQRVWSNLCEEDPFPEEEQAEVRHYRKTNPPPPYEKKKPYLYRLYLRYCYELHIIETHPASVQRVSFFMREDLIALEKLDAETRLLAKNQISTYEEMKAYQATLNADIESLIELRAELRNDVKRYQRQCDSVSAETAKGQISTISKQIRELRKEVSLCKDIVLRSAQTREELEWILDQQEIQERKEANFNEQFRGRSGANRPYELGGR